jgi:hypothetical protein
VVAGIRLLICRDCSTKFPVSSFLNQVGHFLPPDEPERKNTCYSILISNLGGQSIRDKYFMPPAPPRILGSMCDTGYRYAEDVSTSTRSC